MKTRNSLSIALFSACLSTISLSAAPVTFGQGLETSGSQDFHLIDTGTGVTLTASSQIYFVFSNVTGTLPAALTGPLAATLTLNLTSTTPDITSGTTISESGFTGTFAITLNTPYKGQTDLLSGSISSSANATISGKSGGTGASFSASTPPPGAVIYHSAFVQFVNPTTEALSFALSSVVPSFTGNGAGFLAPFNAAGSETFSSTPAPSVASAPEPVSMLIIGFGMMLIGTVGFRLRRSAD